MSKDGHPTKICFTVMGFGKKTDFRTGKLLNLDATYNEIIKPATQELDIRCVRADEIHHSGMIDKEMYSLLLSADIVIADISASNPNAIYELGVRHALKKGTTIIMSEKSGVLHFDLNHTSTIQYEHLGEDIGCSEARRVKSELKELIANALKEGKIDSPVYTFLPELNAPYLTENEINKILDESSETEKEWSNVFNPAEEALSKGNFTLAKDLYAKALKLRPDNEYLLQRLTLCTYKNPDGNKILACMEAMSVLSKLSPEESNDPETTGLAGAIHKYMWREIKAIDFLDKAISFYNRGYTIKKDYYNGENLALCYLQKYKHLKEMAAAIGGGNEKDIAFNEVAAASTFKSVMEVVEKILASNEFHERSDQKWVYATAAKCSEFLGMEAKHIEYTEKFKSTSDNSWDVITFEENTI